MKKIRENLRDGGQKVLRISNENVRAALMRMKSEKGGCRDDITVEVCSCEDVLEKGQWTFWPDYAKQSWRVRKCQRNREESYWYMFARTNMMCRDVVTTVTYITIQKI